MEVRATIADIFDCLDSIRYATRQMIRTPPKLGMAALRVYDPWASAVSDRLFGTALGGAAHHRVGAGPSPNFGIGTPKH